MAKVQRIRLNFWDKMRRDVMSPTYKKFIQQKHFPVNRNEKFFDEDKGVMSPPPKIDFWKKMKEEIFAMNGTVPLDKNEFERRKKIVLQKLKKSKEFRRKFFKKPRVMGLIERPKNLIPFYVPPKVN